MVARLDVARCFAGPKEGEQICDLGESTAITNVYRKGLSKWRKDYFVS
jgi:hypothetical protein